MFRSPFMKGAILADEAGLGKIIEAGLVIVQMWAERNGRPLSLSPSACAPSGSENSRKNSIYPPSFQMATPFRTV